MDDPQVDDYVRWDDLEGWVYFKDSNHYLTKMIFPFNENSILIYSNKLIT